MQTFTPENLLISLLLIAPGFIASYTAITISVTERKISNTQFMILCLVVSGIVDTLFLAVLQVFGIQVSSPEGIQSVFFDGRFYPEYAALLLVLSVGTGVVFSLALIHDFPSRIRNRMWYGGNLRRKPWQPWEGTMRDAVRNARGAQVITGDGQLVKGIVHEYSRVEKSHELYLHDPYWFDPLSGKWEKGGRGVLLLEDDIVRLEIIEEGPEEDSSSEEMVE